MGSDRYCVKEIPHLKNKNAREVGIDEIICICIYKLFEKMGKGVYIVVDKENYRSANNEFKGE